MLGRDPKTGRLRHVVCIEQDGSPVCEPAVALDQPHDVTVSPDGRNVYVAARESDAVVAFARDRRSGELTQLPMLEGCISDDGSENVCTDGRALRDPRALAVSRNGRQVYVATQGAQRSRCCSARGSGARVKHRASRELRPERAAYVFRAMVRAHVTH